MCAGVPSVAKMWPGNTADAKSFLPVVERMRAKFRVREMCVVADRGMVSEATLEALARMEPPVHYIVGVRMRRTREVGEVVLRSRARWQEVTPERQRAKDPALVLKRELEIRMEQKGLAAEWAEVVRGLDNLQHVELFLQGSRFLLRSQLKGDASQAIRAAEVALPPVLREIA